MEGSTKKNWTPRNRHPKPHQNVHTRRSVSRRVGADRCRATQDVRPQEPQRRLRNPRRSPEQLHDGSLSTIPGMNALQIIFSLRVPFVNTHTLRSVERYPGTRKQNESTARISRTFEVQDVHTAVQQCSSPVYLDLPM